MNSTPTSHIFIWEVVEGPPIFSPPIAGDLLIASSVSFLCSQLRHCNWERKGEQEGEEKDSEQKSIWLKPAPFSGNRD